MRPVEIQLRATVAKPSDYRLAARLCGRAVGSWDYVLTILRDVIGEKGLFLAWNGSELVGMTNFDRCIDGSGWLSMARTDPDWRGGGVAVFLQRQIAAHARRRGIRVLRLWTSSKNKASIRACIKGGFKPVCEASHISCNLWLKRHRPVASFRAPSSSSLKSLLRSSYLSKMNGYMAYKWHIVRATTKVLERLRQRNELCSYGESTFILAKPEKTFRKPESSFALLNGPVAESLRIVKEAGKSLSASMIGSFIPHDRYQLSVARGLGFRVDQWGKHCIVFEKQLS